MASALHGDGVDALLTGRVIRGSRPGQESCIAAGTRSDLRDRPEWRRVLVAAKTAWHSVFLRRGRQRIELEAEQLLSAHGSVEHEKALGSASMRAP